MRLQLDELVRLTGAEVLRLPAHTALRPNHDPETITSGDLFFPMHEYMVTPGLLSLLIQRQASGVVISPRHTTPDPAKYPALGVIRMPQPPTQYFELAKEARRRTGGCVVGVTGSSGKTSTKSYVTSLLERRYAVRATRHSRNLVSDCAGVLLQLDGVSTEAAVIEMAFGAPGNIATMAAMARPHSGIITKVTAEHLDGAGGSWERLIQEKASLGDFIPPDGYLIVNADDPGCSRIQRSGFRCRVLSFGTSNRADMHYGDVTLDEAGAAVTLKFFGTELRCQLQAVGAFQAANAAAAALAGYVLGLSAEEIRMGLEQAPALPRRFQVQRFDQGLTLINDTFSANVDNVLLGLEQARTLASGRSLVGILCGMSNLGSDAQAYNESIGKHAVACGMERLLLLDAPGTEDVRAGALSAGMPPERIITVQPKESLVEAVRHIARPNLVVYCKSSMYLELRRTMENLVQALLSDGWILAQPSANPPVGTGDAR